MERWLELLSQFNFKLDHRAGKKYNNADSLSRWDCDPDQYDCYDRDTIISELPCGGCEHCIKKQEKLSDFFEVDDIVPNTVKQLKFRKSNDVAKPPLTNDDLRNRCPYKNRGQMPNVTLFLACFIALLTLTIVVVARSCLGRIYLGLRNCGQFTYWAVFAMPQILRSGGDGTNQLPTRDLHQFFKVTQAQGTVPAENAPEESVHIEEYTDVPSWISGYRTYNAMILT